MNKLLTISVAAYNVERYIRETIDSLCIPEILDELEVFIIDDGGKDSTYEIAKGYEKRYPDSFHAVHKDNGGWGSTVNYSIKHATGKYFRLLDGDDYFDRGGLIGLIKILSEVDADVVYTGYRRFDDNSRRTVEVFSASTDCQRNKVLSVSEICASDFVMHSSTFRTALLQNNHIEITEHCFYTDNEYRTKAMAFVNKAFITDLSVYQYRVGREGQSIDISGVKKHYKDNYEVLKSLMKFERTLPIECNKQMVNDYIESVVEYHYNILLLINNKEEFIRFDKNIIGLPKNYSKSNSKMLQAVRKTNYRLLTLASLMLRTKINIARKMKMAKSKIAG